MAKKRWIIFILLALLLVLSSTVWAAPAEAAPQAKKAKCGNCKYKVKKGDTLYAIGMRYGVSVKTLKRCNGIKKAKLIQPGWKLWVPCKKHKKARWKGCRKVYKVRKGDTVSGIAYRTCSTVHAIAKKNGIKNVNLIWPQQKLCIPKKPKYCW